MRVGRRSTSIHYVVVGSALLSFSLVGCTSNPAAPEGRLEPEPEFPLQLADDQRRMKADPEGVVTGFGDEVAEVHFVVPRALVESSEGGGFYLDIALTEVGKDFLGELRVSMEEDAIVDEIRTSVADIHFDWPPGDPVDSISEIEVCVQILKETREGNFRPMGPEVCEDVQQSGDF